MSRRQRSPTVPCIATTLLFCAFVVRIAAPVPLSPQEARVVGIWTSGRTGSLVYTFERDRSLSTDNGQYKGKWSIDGNTLKIATWQACHITDAYDIHSFLFELGKFRKTDTYLFEIEFGDEDQTLTLIGPANHRGFPSERIQWVRQPGP
mgnify:FL=1